MRPETIYARYKVSMREGLTDDIGLRICIHWYRLEKVVLVSSVFLDAFKEKGLKTQQSFSALLLVRAHVVFSGSGSL